MVKAWVGFYYLPCLLLIGVRLTSVFCYKKVGWNCHKAVRILLANFNGSGHFVSH